MCHFASASVVGFPHFFLGLHQSSEWCGCGMWPQSWCLGLQAVSRRSSASARSYLGAGMPWPRLGLKLWRPWSRSCLGLNCQHLSLGFQGLGLALVSTKKASCTFLDVTHADKTVRLNSMSHLRDIILKRYNKRVHHNLYLNLEKSSLPRCSSVRNSSWFSNNSTTTLLAKSSSVQM